MDNLITLINKWPCHLKERIRHTQWIDMATIEVLTSSLIQAFQVNIIIVISYFDQL